MCYAKGVTRVLALPLFVFFLAAAVVRAGDQPGYEFLLRSGNFELYQKKSIGDADLIAFRGIGVIEATPIEVATVVLDREHRPEWMHETYGLRTVRVIRPGRFVEYCGIKTPFIIKNRDFVIETTVEVDPTRTKILIVSKSVVDPDAPETSAVRGQMNEGRFTIEPGPVAGTTRITADMDVDPKGTCPRWIVNRYQRNWPGGMFHAMRGFLARKVATLPEDLKPLFAAPTPTSAKK